ncbi:hypothetical protein LOTGIDRAFT_157217 [Lottia gigantea]|uniref:Uncharacterized protein n=1 Tax=Lottia gigantea TaxID=225164 RepID=V4B3U8_LOTGI|nr:hypothetical protein LOTGIDRAFT_157217 [Lottia gigantea]ESP02071.1 hypothetical protein LOTGIDRAFT_157217 [Lottia gigantea]
MEDSNRGSSLIDYVLADIRALSNITKFGVNTFNEFSYHASLCFRVKLEHKHKCVTPLVKNSKDHQRLNRWNPSKSSELKQLLLSELDSLTNLVNSSPMSVDNIAKNISCVLQDVGARCLGVKTVKSSTRSSTKKSYSNEWFDSKCRLARQDFNRVRNKYLRKRCSTNRKCFCSARSYYSKVKRHAKFKLSKLKARKISSLHKCDPKQFWNEIKSSYHQVPKTDLCVNDFFEHFKAAFGNELNSSSNTLNDVSDHNGILFYQNGTFHKAEKRLASQGRKALGAVISRAGSLCLDIRSKCTLYNSCVASVLLYGCEVWGFIKGRNIEIIQNDFVRYTLSLGKATPLIAAISEIGLYPLSVIRKCRILKYWQRIALSNNPLLRAVYEALCSDALSGKHNWLYNVKILLDQIGFSYVFTNPGSVYFKSLKSRIYDQYVQEWWSSLVESSKLRFFRNFKINSQYETYLDANIATKFRSIICKFRCGNLQLRVETGRYTKIPRDKRICECCKSKHYIEDEFHFLLCCPIYSHLRQKFFHKQFWSFPSLLKMNILMNPKSHSQVLSLGRYLYEAYKLRETIVINL